MARCCAVTHTRASIPLSSERMCRTSGHSLIASGLVPKMNSTRFAIRRTHHGKRTGAFCAAYFGHAARLIQGMRWYLRSALDNLKGVIPGQSLLRDCKRRLIPYKACAGRADATIAEGIQLIDFVRSSREIAGAACLEVGVGWEPLIPFLFSLCGARKVYMTDLNR